MRLKFVNKPKKKKFQIKNLFSVDTLIQNPEPDYGLLLSVLGLLVFGWVMVYSSSALFAEARYHDQFYFLKRQVVWSLIGLAAFIISVNTPMEFWQRNIKPIFFGTLALLVLVLVAGPEIAGARRWMKFGGFSIQPSELGKLTLIFLVADYMDRRKSRLKDFKRGLLPLLAMTGALLVLIFMEPDLGTPVLLGTVMLCLLILGGARLTHLALMALAVLPFLLLAVVKVRYRLERFFAYLNPWEDPFGRGYQLVQSLLAMGSGGIFGRGLGNSKIKIAHLPDAHTDFVFSILGEELGLLGTILCASFFLFIAFRGLKISEKANDSFSQLVAAGISLVIGLQAIINMGVASGLFPTKGMPLPFISAGGSSLVVTLMSVGILTRISKQGRKL